MRINSPATARARAFTRSVFPTPGTPSISACPPASSVTSARSMASLCPTITRPSASRTRRAPLVIVVDAAADCVAALAGCACLSEPNTGSSFMRFEPPRESSSVWPANYQAQRGRHEPDLLRMRGAQPRPSTWIYRNGLRILRRPAAVLVPALRHYLCARDATLKKVSRGHASAFPMAHDLRILVAPRASHQIAAHAPKQDQQSRPEKHQRSLQPVSLHQPKHALILVQSVQRLIHPNHRPSAGQKIQHHRVRTFLDRLVQQERLLARGDQFAISDSPHRHINTPRCVSLRVLRGGFRGPRIERGPVLICLEPGSIRAEIHHLAARRHFAEIGRDPGWTGFVWSFLPVVLDFPPLRLRL